jgi:hypothetical protein
MKPQREKLEKKKVKKKARTKKRLKKPHQEGNKTD